jgi:hypothetical protein
MASWAGLSIDSTTSTAEDMMTMLDDMDDDQLRVYGISRNERTTEYRRTYVRQNSNTYVTAPLDQGDVAEVNRMLDVGASPADIRRKLDALAEDRWGK